MEGQLKNNELFKQYEYKLRNVPVSAAIQFMRIVRQVEPYIETIDIPTFIVQGKCDGIVPYSTAQYLYDKLPTTEKYIYYFILRKTSYLLSVKIANMVFGCICIFYKS